MFIVILDGVGIGALPDAADYGDEDADTLGHLYAAVPWLSLPHLERWGLDRLLGRATGWPLGAFGRAALSSAGKDTMTGHWELMGVISEVPFRTYPRGFPPEVIEEFERAIGREVLGNKPASGTAIIEELGEEHMRTGKPIVYTSADSVFQIAAHEEIIPVEELYRMCRVARDILRGEHQVGRVIARPFVGRPGSFVRTPRRHDFALEPPEPTALDRLSAAGVRVTAVGKIYDIFSGRGITDHVATKSNEEGMKALLELARARTARHLVFCNLVDFDMKYGHRNDPEGFARALRKVDDWLPDMSASLAAEDLLIVTADHGCDPTTPGTDHTREFVPVIIVGREVTPVDLGTRDTLADIGATVAEIFGIESTTGTSFLPELLGTREVNRQGEDV